MDIQCPTGNMNALVTGPGSGSGCGSGSGSGGGTMCVYGIVTDSDTGGQGLPTAVAVIVLCDFVIPPLAPPSNVVFATLNGQNWCATNVPVPDSSPDGVPVTAAAWSKSGSIWSGPTWVWFYAGGPSPINCCAGSGCQSVKESQRIASSADPSAFRSWPPPPPPLPPNISGGRK